MACNAWVFCGAAGGCHNATTSYAAAKNECSLYYASDLDYNVPLDKNVGVVRAPDVTFVSGETPSAWRLIFPEESILPSHSEDAVWSCACW